jgi:RND superfamily putative drug exporter
MQSSTQRLATGSARLLGERNWYLPRWLSWLPNVSIEVSHDMPAERALVPSPATD